MVNVYLSESGLAISETTLIEITQIKKLLEKGLFLWAWIIKKWINHRQKNTQPLGEELGLNRGIYYLLL